MRTHITRWLAVHAAELTAEQRRAVEDALTVVEPDLYRVGGDELRKTERVQQMTERARDVLTRQQFYECFVGGAPYIPPPASDGDR